MTRLKFSLVSQQNMLSENTKLNVKHFVTNQYVENNREPTRDY